jgi:hypothetical protein
MGDQEEFRVEEVRTYEHNEFVLPTFSLSHFFSPLFLSPCGFNSTSLWLFQVLLKLLDDQNHQQRAVLGGTNCQWAGLFLQPPDPTGVLHSPGA